MDSPSAPQQPDPVVTANAQGTANSDAARVTTALNRANQYTPLGSLTWTQGAPTRTFNEDRYNQALKLAQTQATANATPPVPQGEFGGMMGGAPTAPNPSANTSLPDRNSDQFYDMKPSDNWASKITLDPRVQQLLDSQLQTSQGLQGAIDHSLGQVNQTFATPPPTADEAYRQKVEDALYGRQTSRLDPQFQQNEDKMRSDLMNRGIVEGSGAWQQEMDNMNRAKNDAYENARLTSISGGTDAEAKQLQMQESARMNVLNELNSLRTGSQSQMPNFSATPSGATVNPAPIAQSIYNNYQGQLGQYNAGVASNNATTGAAASIGAAAVMAMF